MYMQLDGYRLLRDRRTRLSLIRIGNSVCLNKVGIVIEAYTINRFKDVRGQRHPFMRIVWILVLGSLNGFVRGSTTASSTASTKSVNTHTRPIKADQQ